MYHKYTVDANHCYLQRNSSMRRIAQIESKALMKQMLMIAT